MSDHRRKLTAKQVSEIRAGYPRQTLKELAAKYGIHPATVSLIIRGLIWKPLLSCPRCHQPVRSSIL
jgi:hypothetical protein